MKPWRTLRGRLVGSMTVAMLLVIAAAASLDEAARRLSEPQHRSGLLRLLQREPYQDGLMLAASGLLLLALVWLVGTWSLRPLRRASEEARLVGPGYTARRLTRRGMPAEVTPLVDAVNGALSRMEEAVETERRFTENAAHELRTPLAVLRLRLQRGRQDAAALDWPGIDRDFACLEGLVAQLLDLARKENGAGQAPQPFNLCRVAREAAASVVPLAEAKHRRLEVHLPDELAVSGYPDDLRDALRNILENALAHGGGTIRLDGGVRDVGTGRQAVIVVVDEGHGMRSLGDGVPAEMAFERFRKGRSSTGNGLGLAITRAVMRRHGGEAAFLPGPCCQVELALPSN